MGYETAADVLGLDGYARKELCDGAPPLFKDAVVRLYERATRSASALQWRGWALRVLARMAPLGNGWLPASATTCSRAPLTACGESRSSSPLVIGEGIDRIDPAPYTVAHGHGHPRPRTTSVVGLPRRICRSRRGHPFYTRLNALLDADGFDTFVEDACRSFYAPVLGRPSLAPG